MTFKHYLLLKGYTSKSIASIEKIAGFFTTWYQQDKDGKDISETGHREAMTYIQHCQQRGISNKTIANYVNHTNKYFDYLIREGQTNNNPFGNIHIQGIKRRMLYNLFSMEELETIYKEYGIEAHNTFQGQLRKRNKAMLGLMIYQGLQVEELIGATIQDLKLREGKIHIPGRKRSAERTLKLESAQLYDLMEYVQDTRIALLHRHRAMHSLQMLYF